MFKRKIYDQILKWKNSEFHRPLIISGLRQIGKTTIVEEFAKNNYESFVKLDFRKNKSLKEIFNGDFDIDNIIFSLSLKFKNFKAISNKTLLIFDELQDCPNARSSLKYFNEDGRFDVICTGSLLGIKNYRKRPKPTRGIPVGFEDYLKMKPMDFEEFLWANGVDEKITQSLYINVREKKPLQPFLHERLMELFNKYICIGGMPEVVDSYLKTNNFNVARNIQKRLLQSFEADFGSHLNDEDEIVIDEEARTKIIETFKSIPMQLAKDNQKFQYTNIVKNAKSRKYKTSLDWLENYGLVSKCYNLSLLEEPLDSFKISNTFKIFMNDSGLYIAMLDDSIPDLIINGKLRIAKGAIYENIVADALSKLGKDLFYYRKNSGLEIDFISTLDKEVVLIEVKAKSGNTKSAREILEKKNKYKINKLIKLTAQNISINNEVETYPYYLSSFLFNEE